MNAMTEELGSGPGMEEVRSPSGTMDLTFRGVPMSDELVFYVRRCRSAWGPLVPPGDLWTVRLERSSSGKVRARVLVTAPAVSAWSVQEDPDAFLAVRNAFAVLEERVRRALGRVDGA